MIPANFFLKESVSAIFGGSCIGQILCIATSQVVTLLGSLCPHSRQVSGPYKVRFNCTDIVSLVLFQGQGPLWLLPVRQETRGEGEETV